MLGRHRRMKSARVRQLLAPGRFDQLYGDSSYHLAIRNTAVQYLR